MRMRAEREFQQLENAAKGVRGDARRVCLSMKKVKQLNARLKKSDQTPHHEKRLYVEKNSCKT